MAALTCFYSSSCSPATASSWKEAAAPVEQKQGVAVAAEEAAVADEEGKRTLRSKIISRRRSEEEGGGEEEVWEGVVSREIWAGVEEVWEMMGKFGGMKRWNAIAEGCEGVEGAEGEVGCVCYCAGGGRWVKEKLLALHPAQHRYTYTMIDSSYGFQGYVATIAFLPMYNSRTLAHWTFRLDPVPHLAQNKLLDLLTFIFDRMMSSLEDTIVSSFNPSSASPPPPPADVAN